MLATVEVGGVEYRLRYTLDDVKRCEEDLGGLGYIYFFREPRIGATTLHPLIHRGLRRLDAHGELVYATEQFSSQGRAAAGEILNGLTSRYTFDEIFFWVFNAFVESGWFPTISGSESESESAGPLAETQTHSHTQTETASALAPRRRKKKMRA
jgi:hypothetical protein